MPRYPIKTVIYDFGFCTFAGRTAKKFDLCFPRKGTAWPQTQFPHLCVCERFIYSHDPSTYFPAAEYADRLWEYINRTQKYKCRNGTVTAQFLFWEYMSRIFGIVSLQNGDYSSKYACIQIVTEICLGPSLMLTVFPSFV
jgi:hypothetical protein